MAANPPYEGAVFVPGTMEEVGVALLAKADDPAEIVAYAGYGFWAPSSVVTKTKGAKKQELENDALAPRVASGVEIPELDGQVADENPLGGEVAEHEDPTVKVGIRPEAVPAAEKPQKNTAAAEPEVKEAIDPTAEFAAERKAAESADEKSDAKSDDDESDK